MSKEHVKAALLEARDALEALIAADETQEAIVEASELILSPFHQLIVQLTADPQRNLPPSLSRLIPR